MKRNGADVDPGLMEARARGYRRVESIGLWNTRTDWPATIRYLNHAPTRAIRVPMGTPGSAQATRCRLLHQYDGLDAWTVGADLYLGVA